MLVCKAFKLHRLRGRMDALLHERIGRMDALLYDCMDAWLHVRIIAWTRGCIVARSIDGQRYHALLHACAFAWISKHMQIPRCRHLFATSQ